MKSLKAITEAMSSELVALLKSFGAGEIEFDVDYMSTMFRKKQQINDLLRFLPTNVDYDVFVFEIDDETAFKRLENHKGTSDNEELLDKDDEYHIHEIGYEDLTDQFHEYKLVIYLFNGHMIESKPENDPLEERKRVIKVNSKGKRRVKIVCRKGFKFDGSKCIKISGKELVTRKKAIIKAVRTKRSQGSGQKNRTQRLRKIALRKRRGQGL